MKAISCWLFVLAFLFGLPSAGFASEAASALRTADDPVSADLAVEYQAIKAEIEELIEGSGVKLLDLQINQGIETRPNGSENAPSTQATSCTLSAQVNIGVAQVTITVTAPTCAEATAELMSAIRSLLQER